MGCKEFLLILVLLLIPISSASFITGNLTEQIETTYSPGDYLKGWINISIQNEKSDSLISSSLAGGTALLSFLENNSAQYSCLPLGCGNDYAASNGGLSKTFQLNDGEEKVIAFKAGGMINTINSFSFEFSVANSKSCINPLTLDLLDDGTTEWRSKRFSSDFICTYSGGRGCFNPAEPTLRQVTIMGSNPYCGKIKLGESGKFFVGAWVKKGTTAYAAGDLKMTLYDVAGAALGNCDLPTPLDAGGEIGCNITYSNAQTQEFYVCINSNKPALEGYNLTAEDINPCGCYGVPPGTEKHDYWIFAQAAEFDNIGKVIFNQAEYASQGNSGILAEDVLNSLNARYGKNCTTGCTIPVRFKARGSLSVIVSNLSQSYTYVSEPLTPDNNIYDTSKRASTISSGFLELDLSYAKIKVPDDYGDYTVDLFLGGTKILSKDIYVAQVPQITSISPMFVPAGIMQTFKASTSSAGNKSIKKYIWTFGDNSPAVETLADSTTHLYSATGSYQLKLRIEDEVGLASEKIFNIAAGNPKQLVNETLRKYRGRITNLTSQTAAYPSWQGNFLAKELDLEGLDSDLKIMERKFEVATSDEEYIAIISNLTEMKVPALIRKTDGAGFPLLLDTKNVKREYFENLEGRNYDNGSEQDYQDALLRWYDSEMKANIDYSVISAQYDDETKTVATYFKLKINPNEKTDYESYVVIGERATVNNEDTKELKDAVGLKFSTTEARDIEFFVPGEINPLQVKVYIAPEVGQLDISPTYQGVCDYDGKCEAGETWKNCRDDCQPVGRIVVYILILVFIAFVVYLVMQEWYKRKYENFLFKNKNDLYNLINFIANADSKGMDRKEIEKRLKQSGWSSEQVEYAMKKVKGKKTGVPVELNIFKFLEKK